MAKDKIRVAVAGCGNWGKNLVRTFFNLQALDIVCDADEDRLREVRQRYSGVKTTSVFVDILKNKDISAVVIATPAESHYHLALQALMAGKDVFIEKPLALKLEEGKELVDLAKQIGKIIIVGHVLEYHPAIRKLKELIDKGELGALRYIYSNRLNLGKFRKEENILWSFAPHDISVMLLLLGEMPQSVAMPPDNIITTMEAHMKCGVGKCGHCYADGKYICTDGPVFSYTEIKQYNLLYSP